MNQQWELPFGASYLGSGRCRFRVWAPCSNKVELLLMTPQERLLSMERDESGYHQLTVDGVDQGTLYRYRLNGIISRPDPASRSQPHGVHGPSQVVDQDFAWSDGSWIGPQLSDYIIYELHVGTFSAEGTFDAIIPHLDELQDLGITAIELMPVAQFPGDRNWGYDGVFPFAVQSSYGGPGGLKRLVNACHQRGMAVVLDVVYNHLGPEGNYLADFGPYFTERYRTPWGPAINFDGPHSDEVRRFFIGNAIHWMVEYHLDALRLDALHAILDISPRPFVAELAVSVQEQARQLYRRFHLFAESAANDARLVRSRDLGGYGLDAYWNEDFHHSLHVLLTGEQTGYYQDFSKVEDIATTFRQGFVYSGQYSPYHRRRHGSPAYDIAAERFVAFAQNHDQVGNRLGGERLTQLVAFDQLKLAAALVLLSPFIPLLFMGEEYGENAPFLYFISHTDPALVDAVRRGRCEEFAAFRWQGEPPDPQDESTFMQAKLNHSLRGEGRHRVLNEFHAELIRLRRTVPALSRLSKEDLETVAYNKERVLLVRRWCQGSEVAIVFSFADSQVSLALPLPCHRWQKRLDSAEARWLGSGSTVPARPDLGETSVMTLPPMSVVLLESVEEA